MTDLQTVRPDPEVTTGSSPLAPQTPLGGAQSPYWDAEKRYLADYEKRGEQAQKTFDEGEAAVSPLRDRYLKMLSEPNVARAHLEKVADAPKPQDYQKMSMEYAGAMALMGAIGGRFTRNVGNASLKSFGAALKGWQDGNVQAYTDAVNEWKQNTQRTIENNNVELEKYREILANKHANIDQMLAAMNVVASQYQNRIMFEQTQQKNSAAAFAMVDKLASAQAKLQGGYDKLTGLYGDQRQQIVTQIDELNKNPQLAQRLMQEKPTEWLKLKAAAGAFGITLNEPAQGTQPLPKVASTPRSAPAMALQQYIQEYTAKNGHAPTSQEITDFSANYAGEQSYQRGAGSSAQRVENATNEVEQLIPQALESSRNLPRGKYVPWNKLQQQWEAGTSDPAYYDFSLANFSLMNAYARAMNPQGVPRITERLEAHAAGVLSVATDQKSYEVQVARLWKEVQASKNAIAQTQKGRTGGDINAPLPGATGGGASGTTSTGVEYTIHP